MRIIKCDICKKIIKKSSESIHIGLGGVFIDSLEICLNCGKPILKLLKDKKIFRGENKKYEK